MSRIFFLCPHPFHRQVAAELTSRGVEILLFEVNRRYADPRTCREYATGAEIIETFECYDPIMCLPAGTEPQPPSADLLAALAPYEATALQLIDRRNFDRLSVAQLRSIFIQYVARWQALLDKYNPDAIVLHGTPHQGHDYALYHLCRLRGIRTLMLEATMLNQRLFIRESLEDVLQVDPEELSVRAQELRQFEPDVAKVHEDYLELNRGLNDVKSVRRALTWKSLLLDLIHPRNLWSSFERRQDPICGISQRLPRMAEFRARRMMTGFLIRRALKSYDQLSRPPAPGAKYVYLALHFQPERSSVPDGGQFFDHLHVAGMLARALPPDWKLYVKEHPRQFRHNLNWHTVRDPEYYARIAAIPNIQFVPLESDSRRLIGNAQAVATITGTSAWEAVLSEIPAVIFGYPWYRNCPGVMTVNDLESCRAAFAKVAEGHARVDLAEVQAYRELIEQRHTFSGCFADKMLEIANVDVTANGKSYAEAIWRALQSRPHQYTFDNECTRC